MTVCVFAFHREAHELFHKTVIGVGWWHETRREFQANIVKLLLLLLLVF